MTFFNKKEEVLEIKLSSYGKQKLAAGTFKPVYYAFFDDDILYDGARAGVVEDNNNIEPRIQENSPSLRVQTSFTDLEEKVKKQTHEFENGAYHDSNLTDLKSDPSVFQDTDGLRNVLPLGNSQLGNQKVAAWKVQFLEGAFKQYRTTTHDSTLTCATPYSCQKPVINIPQIELDLEVQPKLVSRDFKGVADPVTGRYVALNQATNQFIRLEKDYILLDITEENVDLLNDSFSLEIYEITDNTSIEGYQEVLKPKLFKKEIQQVVDGILLDREEIDAQISDAEIDEKVVEYYFTVSVDDGIDEKTKVDKIIARDKKGNIFDTNVQSNGISQTPGSELYTSDNNGDEC